MLGYIIETNQKSYVFYAVYGSFGGTLNTHNQYEELGVIVASMTDSQRTYSCRLGWLRLIWQLPEGKKLRSFSNGIFNTRQI